MHVHETTTDQHIYITDVHLLQNRCEHIIAKSITPHLEDHGLLTVKQEAASHCDLHHC